MQKLLYAIPIVATCPLLHAQCFTQTGRHYTESNGYTQINPRYGSQLLSLYGNADYATSYDTGNYSPPPNDIYWPTVESPGVTWVPIPGTIVSAVSLRNDDSCTPTTESSSFQKRTMAGVTVTTTVGSSLSRTAVLKIEPPLLGTELNFGFSWTETNSTSWSDTVNTTFAATIPFEYSVDPCNRRIVRLWAGMKTRTVGVDEFGSTFDATGPMLLCSGGTPIVYHGYLGSHTIGYDFNEAAGTIVWADILEARSESEELISGCTVSGCGGSSDGDMDGDDIPDGDDSDMDGDGISNEYDDDMDGDGIPNDRDWDNDNDGIPDSDDDTPYGPDGGDDYDNDGVDNEDDFDIDGDGIPNWMDSGDDGDIDGDGVLNKDDDDIDGDGIPNDEDDTPYGTVPTIIIWDREGWREVPLF